MAADDRKVQLGVTVDATEARKGFNDVKDAARDMAAGVTTQAGNAGKAIDGIGSGAAPAADKMDRATKNMIQSIQRTTAAMDAGSKSSSDYYKALAAQRGISADALAPFLAALDEAKKKQDAASDSMHEFSLNSTRARTELIVLGHELSQGNFSRFGSSLMVMAEATDALSVIMSPLGLSIGAAAAAAALFADAAVKGYEESEAFRKSLILTGNAAGMTADSFNAMAQSLAQSSGIGIGKARDALQALVSTGQFSGQAFDLAASAITKYTDITGATAEQAANEFAKMGDDVAKWVEEHNKQWNFATEAQTEYIKSLQDAGDTQKAEIAALELVNKHFSDDSIEKLGYIEKAWKSVTQTISSAWDSLKDIGRPATVQQQIAGLTQTQNTTGSVYNALAPEYTAFGGATDDGSALEAAELRERAQADADNAAIKAAQAATQKAGQTAYDEIQKSIATYDKAGEAAKKLSAAKANFVSLYKSNPNSDALKGVTVSGSDASGWNVSGGAYDAVVAGINKSATSHTAASQENTQARDVADLKSQIAAQEQQLALMDQYAGAQAKISSGDKKVLDIEQQLTLAQKNRIGQLTDSQLKEQLGYAQTLAAVQKQIKAKQDEQAVQKALNEQVDKWDLAEQTARAGLASDTALYGQEAESRKLMATQLQYEAEARDKIKKIQESGKVVSDEQQANLLAEADARAKVVNSIQGQRDALAAAQQLEQQNAKFAANSIADAQQQNDALVALDAKKWQDLIKNAGDGTEAQQKLISAYNQWVADQYEKPIIDQWKGTINSIGTDFHNGFLQMLTDGKSGWDSFTKSLRNTFEATVVDALYNTFAKKYVIQLVADIAGVTNGDGVKKALLGQSDDGSSITDLLKSSSTLKSLLDLGNSGTAVPGASQYLSGTIGSGTAYDTSGLSSYYTGGGNTYGFVGSSGGASVSGSSSGLLSNYAGALGSLGAGYGIGSVIGGTTGSKVGGSLGSAIGSFAIPIPVVGTLLGGVVGSVLGKVVGGLFGGGETRYGGVYSTTDGTAADTTKVGSGPSGGMNATESSTTVGNVDLTYNTIKTLANALGGSIDGLGTYHAGWELSPSKGNSWVEAGFVQNLSDTSDRTQLSGVKDADTVATDFTLELQRSIVKSLQAANLDKPYAQYLSQFNADTLTADDVTNIENELQTMKAFFDSVKGLGPSFDNLKGAGTSAQNAIANLAGGMDTLSSEIAYYSQNFLSTSEQYATQASGVQSQLDALGEGSVTTKDQFNAVVQSLDLTTDSGQQLYQAMLALAPAFEQMIENEQAAQQAAQQAADAQQSLWDSYYGAVYDSSQQLVVAQGQLQAKFDALGVAMPKTNAEFEALVENMDTSTQQGKDLQDALLALAPAFGQMTTAADQAAQQAAQAASQAAQEAAQAQQSAIDSAKQNVQTAYESQVEALNSTISSLKNFIKTIEQLKTSLAIGDLSTLSPEEKYNEAKATFESTAHAAAGGDADAQANLSQAAQDFLSASKDYNATNAQYASDYDEVQHALSDSVAAATQQISVAQQQLDAANQMVQGILDLNQTAQSLSDALNAYFSAGGTTSDASGGGGSGSGTSLSPGGDASTPYVTPDWVKAAMGMTIGPDGTYGWYSSPASSSASSGSASDGAAAGGAGAATGSAGAVSGGASTDSQYSADQQSIDSLYQEVLGRSADPGGLQFYTDQLTSGKETIDQIKADLQYAVVNGSHAGGADYIPFDGYVAKLHEGEAVITSANNQKLAKLLNDTGSNGTADEFRALLDEVRALRQTTVQVGAAQLDQGAKQHAESQETAQRSRKALKSIANASA